MALKDILVYVDNTKSCPARLAAAIELARSHEAHLCGIHVVYVPVVPTYAEVHIPEAVLAEQRQAALDQAAAAAALFRRETSKQGLNSEWRQADGDIINILAMHARYFDLLVLGQPDDRDAFSPSLALPDNLVLESGRPVLVIPYIGTRPGFGQRVLVGWNASREAVRAVNDALPLLTRATKVDVVAVNPGAEGDTAGADICLHLARHGVKAEANLLRARNIEPGDLMLSRAADTGADLIVIGAYGHSRFRELVLGGVTRHLLKHMTVPVLLSH